jgi:nucleoside-diphosphate-sugar epimerase
MKLVITGALGHIGSSLIRNLDGMAWDEVVLIDNLATQRYCSLFGLPEDIPFRFVEADVLSDRMEPLLGGADVVIHLAAITNAAGSFDREKEVEEVNYRGTERVARICARQHTKLINLSTTSVYGSQEEVVDETCDQLNPQSPYADSKLRAERLLTELGRDEGLRFVTLRFGTIFGTSIGMRFHTAINKFVWQACLNLPLTVWRTALHQRRPYLDLADGVRALRFVMETDRFDNEIYNVVTLNATVAEVIEVIERALGREIAIELVDARIMNQLSYNVLAKKFEAIGFEGHGDLAAAVHDTVALLQAVSTRPA